MLVSLARLATASHAAGGMVECDEREHGRAVRGVRHLPGPRTRVHRWHLSASAPLCREPGGSRRVLVGVGDSSPHPGIAHVGDEAWSDRLRAAGSIASRSPCGCRGRRGRRRAHLVVELELDDQLLLDGRADQPAWALALLGLLLKGGTASAAMSPTAVASAAMAGHARRALRPRPRGLAPRTAQRAQRHRACAQG